jgi:hypothetical protein
MRLVRRAATALALAASVGTVLVAAAPAARADGVPWVRIVRPIPFLIAQPDAGLVTGDVGSTASGDADDGGIEGDLLPLRTPNQQVHCALGMGGRIYATYEGYESAALVLVDTETEFYTSIYCNFILRELADGSRLLRNGSARAYSVRDECMKCAATYSPGRDFCFGGPGLCDGYYQIDGDELLQLYSGTWGGYPNDDCHLLTTQTLICQIKSSAIYVPPVYIA